MKTLSVRERSILKVQKGFLTPIGSASSGIIEIGTFAVIGRDLACHISLHDPFLSLRHARIEAREDGFYIRDLESSNGTSVNGTQVVEARLNPYDRIKLGQSEYMFTMERLSELSPVLATSKNAAWNEQLLKIPSIAQSPHPVLLLGPSGSGKEVMASLVHKLSHRSRANMLSVNCSALTETLAESELFGHLQGSFSGATTDRKGAFEAARGGTLFLDEIGDLPLSQQPKILRALENQEIRPVGADHNVRVDVRIVAATNRDLREDVRKGRFREDLYFRLHVLQVKLPALRERPEDFDDLLKHFADPLRVRFTLPALMRLREHPWPGNIRELKNFALRASATYPSTPIGEHEVEQLLEPPTLAPDSPPQNFHPVDGLIRQYERDIIMRCLTATGGNQRRAARQLGMPKSTLHDRVQLYQIDVKALKRAAKENAKKPTLKDKT